MNLWSISDGTWHPCLLALAAGGSDGSEDLQKKLGDIANDSAASLGPIHPYFVQRFGFAADCTITPFTGDNPATILALPLQATDAIVSLGTSTTFLMATPVYQPDPAVHFFAHPTTAGLYMFMLCYKNGGLARELIRDAVRPRDDSLAANPWATFDKTALAAHPLGQTAPTDPMKLGLYFPRPEIVPRVPAGTWRFSYHPASATQASPALRESSADWTLPRDDARAILESQLLSLRLRSAALVAPPAPGLPAQPRRVYLVGGGARSPALARLAGEVLGGAEGVFRLDVGANACALGAAYKAAWAAGRAPDEGFEAFVRARWRESDFAVRVDEGYRAEAFERYGRALEGLKAVEARVLESVGGH